MRNKITAVAALLGCGLLTSAQDTRDGIFVSKEGGYSVRFPPWANVKTLAKESPDGVNGTLAMASGPGKDLRVVFSLAPEAFPERDVFAGAEARAKQGDSKQLSVKSIALGAEKYPGREIVTESGGRFNRSRVIVAGRRLYVIGVNGPKEFTTGKEAEDFFTSFEIAPSETAKATK